MVTAERLDMAGTERLLARHLNAALSRFGARALGLIDLPPITEGPVVPAQLRVGAALYWCARLEDAGILSTAEQLARALRTGGLPLEPGPVVERLEALVHGRHDRFTSEERRAIYARLFDATFDESICAYAELLDATARDPRAPTVHATTGIGLAGAALAQVVSPRCVGIAGFAAREIVGDVRTAWAILQDPQVKAAVGARTAWDVVARVAPSAGGPAPMAPDRAQALAESGRDLLAWLADHANGNLSRVAPSPELLAAGTRWLLASR